MTKPQLFHSLTFADAGRARDFLTALGFAEVLVVPSSADPAIVEHAQFQWRDNGGIMFGSVRPDSDFATADSVGRAKCYLVVESDAEVDAVHARGLAAGGTSLQDPVDQDYGGRSACVLDAEGNQWQIGSYAGE